MRAATWLMLGERLRGAFFMHRPTLGAIALVLLASGVYMHLASSEAIGSACLRVGAVMSILWFAHPQIRNVPGWLAAASVVGLLV
jgi:hypothetical protein